MFSELFYRARPAQRGTISPLALVAFHRIRKRLGPPSWNAGGSLQFGAGPGSVKSPEAFKQTYVHGLSKNSRALRMLELLQMNAPLAWKILANDRVRRGRYYVGVQIMERGWFASPVRLRVWQFCGWPSWRFNKERELFRGYRS
jgi:hypothetical protein